MRNHQRRKKGLTQLKRLGRNDRLVAWHKTTSHQRPKWVSKEQWEAMPERLTVREVTVHVDAPGFRTKTMVSSPLRGTVSRTTCHFCLVGTSSEVTETFRDHMGFTNEPCK